MGFIVVSEHEDTCFCDASTKCVLGKIGSQPRCSTWELEKEGFKTVSMKHVELIEFIDEQE